MNIVPLYMLAQTAKWMPVLVPEAGLIIGAAEPSGDWRANALLAKNGWQLGLGGGMDYYRYRSVPVYLQARRQFGKTKMKPFAFASGGLNVDALTESEKASSDPIITLAIWRENLPANAAHHYDPGWYAEAGAGYAFLNKKQHGLMLSASWVQKTTKEWYETTTWAGYVSQPSQESTMHYFNRLVFRVAWQF